MMSLQEYCRENNPKAVQFEGLEEAVIGVGQQYTKAPVLIYSARKIIEVLMKQGLTYEEAMQHYGHNIECTWLGADGTPIIMHDLSVNLKEKDHESTDVFIKGKTHALTPRCDKGRDSPPAGTDVPRVQGSVRRTNRSGSRVGVRIYRRRRA
jgi:hypothetical protein